jgi:hypothetical protein
VRSALAIADLFSGHHQSLSIQEPSGYVQTVAVAYHVERMHGGCQGTRNLSYEMLLIPQDESRPQGVIWNGHHKF